MRKPGPKIIKLNMLNSAEHKIYPVIKVQMLAIPKPSMKSTLYIDVQMSTLNCWHLNIYEQDKFHAQLS